MKVSLLKMNPVIRASRIAYEKITTIVELCDKEVSWLGLVSRQPNDLFLIEDVFLVEQEVSGASTDMVPADVSRLCEKLFADGVLTREEQDTRGLYLWGHSHVNMSVGPSGVDLATAQDFVKEHRPPFQICQIVNKRGEWRNDLYLCDDGIRIDEMSMEVVRPENPLRAAIEAEIKEKVKEKTYSTFKKSENFGEKESLEREEFMRDWCYSGYTGSFWDRHDSRDRTPVGGSSPTTQGAAPAGQTPQRAVSQGSLFGPFTDRREEIGFRGPTSAGSTSGSVSRTPVSTPAVQTKRIDPGPAPLSPMLDKYAGAIQRRRGRLPK